MAIRISDMKDDGSYGVRINGTAFECSDKDRLMTCVAHYVGHISHVGADCPICTLISSSAQKAAQRVARPRRRRSASGSVPLP